MATPTTVTSAATLTVAPTAAVDEDAPPDAAEQHVVVECPAWCERGHGFVCEK